MYGPMETGNQKFGIQTKTNCFQLKGSDMSIGGGDPGWAGPGQKYGFLPTENKINVNKFII